VGDLPVGSPQVEAVQLFGEACSASAVRGNGLAIFRLRLGFVFLEDFRMRSGLENGSHGLAKIMERWLRIVPVKGALSQLSQLARRDHKLRWLRDSPRSPDQQGKNLVDNQVHFLRFGAQSFSNS